MDSRFLLGAVLVVGFAVVLARGRGPGAALSGEVQLSEWVPDFIAPAEADEEPPQGPSIWEQAVNAMDPTTYFPTNVPDDVAAQNLRATLDTIRWCEGTLNDMGYRTMFGYRYFDSFADHPRQYWPYTNQAGQLVRSSAAGAYQIIVATWDKLRARLGLPDFSPASQDAAAIELIRECGALEDAKAGRIEAVARKCRGVWASLPGSNVSQPTRSIEQVIAAFNTNGGTAVA